MMTTRWLMTLVIAGGVLAPTMAFGRAWRDQKGKTINADFVKVERGMVYLKPENKYATATPFPFYDFCEADQEFVKAILEKKGQSDRIPPPPPSKDNPNGMANRPGQADAGRVPVAVKVVPNSEPVPQNNFNSDFRVPIQEPATSVPSVTTTPAIPIAVAPPFASTMPPPSRPSSNLLPMASPGFASSFGPQAIAIKKCLSCNKEIPMTSHAGQSCPHCGVFWSVEKNEFGQVTTTAPGGFNNGPLHSRGVIRLGFLIGAFVVGGIAKLIHDKK